MMGSSGERKFIPYPVQNNIHVMDSKEQQKCLRGLEKINLFSTSRGKPKNFDEWLVRNFGEGLSEVFMRRYNHKVWTVDPKEMNSDWVGERVAVPNVKDIKSKIAQWNNSGNNREQAKDSNWGPNQMFEFPAYGGTGQIWKNVANLLPREWFHYGHIVTAINSENKKLDIVTKQGQEFSLNYDHLISTAPLDCMLSMVQDSDKKLKNLKRVSREFVFSHTHVVGVGLQGQPPSFLANKSWIYFPDSDSPFYRITVLSNYADDNVPHPGKVWSLMCEAAEPRAARNLSQWQEKVLVQWTIDALLNYGFISHSQVLSTYHRRLEHGYPVPFLKREEYLSEIQPWLQERSIYSRGRFGGWRYEVSNQDHSFMQGVEIADFIMFGIPEETYPNASLVNSMRSSDRSICQHQDYEIVVAHYDEDLSWVAPYANHCHVYHKGGKDIKPTFKMWETLPNVGRESHTYLHHIVTHYHCLANVTLFVQGEVKNHVSWSSDDDLQMYMERAKNEGMFAKNIYPYVEWGRVNHRGKWKEMKDSGEMARANMTIGEFWKLIFDKPHPQNTTAFYHGIFSVSRQRILSRPLKFYENAISFVDHHQNPEEGHYLERMWASIFSE